LHLLMNALKRKRKKKQRLEGKEVVDINGNNKKYYLSSG
jgi:hypothetical protein